MAAGEDRMKFPKSTTHYFLAILVCIASAVAASEAQNPTPKPGTPTPPAVKTPAKVKIKEKETKPPRVLGLPPQIDLGPGFTSERSIKVDPKVTLKLCVSQGTVTVNGWSRNEVRVFVKDGSKYNFKVVEKSREGNPVWISLVGIRQLPGGATAPSDCIAGDEIELDVPETTDLTFKGGETTTSIERIRRVALMTAGGGVTVRNVSQGVSATTYDGDVIVTDSEGQMVLETTSGNIVASGVAPSEAGNAFKAKTNSGAISLQKMEFRVADVNSISGSVLFTGDLLSGGSFSFSTTNGALRLAIPGTTSCRVFVTYAYGNFKSELPLQIITENVSPGSVKRVVGTLGSVEGNDCTLRLTTNTGAIGIRKQ